MKATSFLLIGVMVFAAPVRSQVTDTADSREPTAGQVTSPATARILGDIPDGTPPPPTPPKPKFVVPAKDVLSTTTQQQGGRTITINRIKPIALPAPPEPAPAPVAPDESTPQERSVDLGAPQPEWDLLFLGATVYRSKDSPPRTLVSYWPNGSGEPVSFWSSADFGLLSGFGDFVAADGHAFSVMLMWSSEDIDRTQDIAADGGAVDIPAIPAFPNGKATFTIIGNAPADPDVLMPIQALHDIYNNEFVRLKAAYDGRERARLQHEAELRANPPRPKNITLNYWRIERPAPAKGGAK